jgi:hypothetical protein
MWGIEEENPKVSKCCRADLKYMLRGASLRPFYKCWSATK